MNQPTKAPRLHYFQKVKYTHEGQPVTGHIIGCTPRTLIVLNEQPPRYSRAISPARITEIFND